MSTEPTKISELDPLPGDISDTDLAVVARAGSTYKAPGSTVVGSVERSTRRYRVFPNVGTRVVGGRIGTQTGTSGRTYHAVFSTAAKFSAVRMILIVGPEGMTLTAAKASTIADASDLNNNAGTWSSLFFNDGVGTTLTLAADSSRKHQFVFSDWLALDSLDRTDGGQYSLAAFRIRIMETTLTVLGNGTDSFTNWATKPDGRIHVFRADSIDRVTDPTGFSNTVNQSQSAIVGVQYMARNGEVMTMLAVGDSITEGRSTYLGESWHMPCAKTFGQDMGVAVEVANIGWSGASTAVFTDYALSFLSACDIPPEVTVFPNQSPNDVSTVITKRRVATSLSKIDKILDYLRYKGSVPILWTSIPVSSTVRDYNATDLIRRDFNDYCMTFSDWGFFVSDFSTSISGSIDGDGQMQPAVGALVDGIHPSDSGNATLATVLLVTLKSVYNKLYSRETD